MSFLKITDPDKRDFIVQEYLKTKKNVQQNYVNDRTGEIDTQRDLTKFFKPIIVSQKTVAQDLAKEITEPMSKALLPIAEGAQKAISFPKYPSIQAYDDADAPDTGILYLGDIATQYLRQFALMQKTNKSYGIYDKDGQFYIGNTPVEINDNNIKIGAHKEYRGTPGLWELLVMDKPDQDIISSEDLRNYSEILIKTSAIRQKNNPNSSRPKASRSEKWTKIIKPIWETRAQYEGNGFPTVVLPSDPNALIDRLDLLMASRTAGNTGVRNEIVGICDELLRQNVITRDLYKKLMLQI